MRFWVFILILLSSNHLFAGIEFNLFDTSRFSRGEGKLLGDQIAPINTIYGGIANNTSGGCTTVSQTSTCNSCDGAATSTACNRTAIHDSLVFSFTFTNTGTAGRILVTSDTDDSQVALDYTGYDDNIDLPANAQVTIGVTWNEICTKLFTGATACTTAGFSGVTNKTARLRVGIDEDDSNSLITTSEYLTEIEFVIADMTAGDGSLCFEGDASPSTPACNFIAFPGDSKIFLENVRTNCSFPDLGGDADARFIRVFYEAGDADLPASIFPDITTANVKDLEIGDTSSCSGGTKVIGLAQNEVDGLSNDVFYNFSIGVVDEANNVGNVISLNNTNETDTTVCFDAATDNWNQNCHIARPSEVIGLIQDEFDCFITTATYGSPFRPKVEDFRKFRNKYLKTNILGQWLINSYYKMSPPVAKWIRNNPETKPYVRFFLYPFWLFAYFCLRFPVLILITIVSLIAFSMRKPSGVSQ